MISDNEILRAVESLRDEWPILFVGGEAGDLARWMGETDGDEPESVRLVTYRILDLLERHPQAMARVSGELGIKGSLRSKYDRPPGERDPVPPGGWVVCPVDPGHYKVQLHQVGQRCPEHGALLVSADAPPTQE